MKRLRSIAQRLCGCCKKEEIPPPVLGYPNLTLQIDPQNTYESPNLASALYDYDSREEEEELTIKKGDKIEINNVRDDGWTMVTLLAPPFSSGLVPSDYIATKGSIEYCEWFYGNLDRKEAERLLKFHKNSFGSFLVRQKTGDTTPYAISVRSEDTVLHYLVHCDNDEYYLNPGLKHSSVEHLIDYYREHPCGKFQKLGKACVTTFDEWELDRSLLKVGKKVGSGNFAKVYEGCWNEMTQVAVKKLKKETLNSEEILAEANIMKQLHHHRVVQLYGICTIEDPFYIVTEFMCNGALNIYLRSHEGKSLDEPTLIDMAGQVASGMSYLEAKNYVHRDLAARNVLVGNNHVCKVADFGLARLTSQDEVYVSHMPGLKIPIKWTAPEGLKFKEFSIKSDVWSFGILLTEIIEKGMVPFPGHFNDSGFVTQICGGLKMQKNLMPNCPDKLYKIMLECWKLDPDLRPRFEQLLRQLDDFYPDPKYTILEAPFEQI